jgi:hypothetical protein
LLLLLLQSAATGMEVNRYNLNKNISKAFWSVKIGRLFSFMTKTNIDDEVQ